MIYSFRRGKPENGWVLIVHGLGEHIGRYEKMIKDLEDLGFGVIGFDLPGHGRSDGIRGDTDIEEVISIIDDLTKDLGEFHIFGHSLGGLIAVRYVEERGGKIKSLVVSSPALYVEVSPFLRKFVEIFSKLTPHRTISNGLDTSQLSRNRNAVEKYIKDPLVHDKISFRLGNSMAKNIEIAHQKAKEIKVPVLILIGTADKITPPKGSIEFFEKLTSQDKALVKFEGGYHELFEDEEHSERFYNTIYEWLKRH